MSPSGSGPGGSCGQEGIRGDQPQLGGAPRSRAASSVGTIPVAGDRQDPGQRVERRMDRQTDCRWGCRGGEKERIKRQ